MNNQAPTLMKLDGKEVHPLVYAAAHYTYAYLGELLGHTNHSTAAIYASRARKRPKGTIVPAEWVLPLARLLEVKPHALRPDLYLSSWTL